MSRRSAVFIQVDIAWGKCGAASSAAAMAGLATWAEGGYPGRQPGRTRTLARGIRCSYPEFAHVFYLFQMSSGLVRPDWWCYPDRCGNGHRWAPGLVSVSWMPCNCAVARDGTTGRGHLRVSCLTDGCRSVWYPSGHGSESAGVRQQLQVP